MKLRLLAAAVAALTLTAGIAGAQDLNSEKGKLSYAFGYDFARNLAESGEQIDTAAVVKAVTFYAANNATKAEEILAILKNGPASKTLFGSAATATSPTA